ncbi:MAG: hypothetical protein WEC72_00350 [Chthoniobacterales bacterium]
MNIAIALAQFIMLALATMASHILVNSGAVPAPPVTWSDMIATFVARQGLWLLIIPAAWLGFAGWSQRAKGPLGQVAQPLGVGITVTILVAIVLVLVF